MCASRPEILFPLFAEVTALTGIGEKVAKLYEKLGVTRVRDLLYLLPTSVIDRRLRHTAMGAQEGEVVTVEVEVGQHRPGRTESQPYRVACYDAEVGLEVVFFRARSDWVQRVLPPGRRVVISGKVDYFDDRLQIAHPDLIISRAEAESLPPFEPVYPLTQGLGQKNVRSAVGQALDRMPDLPEWIDPGLRAREVWPSWAAAMRRIHNPEGTGISRADPARQRLAYDELLSHQLALALARARMKRGKGRPTTGDGSLREKVLKALPYAPTGAQQRAVAEIAHDMGQEERMLRLLQGDVGAGKTLVALMAMLIAVEAGGQAALMAPTEILARQHGAALMPLAEAAGVRVVVLTGRDKGSRRAGLLSVIGDGSARIVIGTHALFQRDVAFRDLRLVIVDEQHRFGVKQRMELTGKAEFGADVLVMTATPIPRTLALAGYGDLDTSILDEKPPGRQPIDTAAVPMGRYPEIVERLRAAIGRGQRAYWVCPLVDESELSDLTAAEDRFAQLAQELGPEHVALVHGQMPPDEKDAAMHAFQTGAKQVLVATTVIEVGVDVPEATIMVIERAEAFGLAQLHQLRGRVGRGAGRSACVLLYEPPLGETAAERLQTLRDTEDGFRIAEADLKLRGAGDVLGTAQSGLPRFAVADLETDMQLMQIACDEARLVVATNPYFGGDGTGPASEPDERAKALRILLYLMERDVAVRFLKSA